MKQIYLGGTPLIDLTGYATESYVDSAVSNVDVTEQLNDYVQKTALDASYGALDASIKSSDSSIAGIKSILSQITGDGAEVTAAIDTFNELKAFVQDYTTSNDLSTLIAEVKSQAVDDASADAAGKYQPLGSYLVANDISTLVDAAAVSAQINSSIAALDLANTYQPKGSYLTSSDLAGYATSDDISTFITENDASIYQTKNDSSNHIAGAGVTNIVYCTSTQYAAIETKSATTLYIVTD